MNFKVPPDRLARRKRTNLLSLLSIAGVSLVLLGCAAFSNWLYSESPSDAAQPNQNPIAAVQLAFAAPNADLETLLLDNLALAEHSIDIAIYKFNADQVATVLAQAVQQGVKVRIVTDTDNADTTALHDLQTLGVPVVEDDDQALMHNKFAVLDQRWVLTGSANWTDSGLQEQDNNLLVLDSPALAANYSAEFEEMFSDHIFAGGKRTQSPILQATSGPVESYFSPDDGVAAKIKAVLESAQQSIYFMAFSFTRRDFAEILVSKHDAGLAVQGVFDGGQIEDGQDTIWRLLRSAGLAVRQSPGLVDMHHKVWIVDGKIVITGSYNFTNNAETRNSENILILRDSNLAAQFQAEFERVWQAASQYNQP